MRHDPEARTPSSRTATSSPTARDPRRSFLLRLLRPRENAPTSCPGVRAARANRSVGRLGAEALAVLALATLALAVPERAQAQTVHEVAADWALKPADINVGDKFRLLFITSTGRDATPTAIATYNVFVQVRAGGGAPAIEAYSSNFRALVSTQTVNARVNTQTRATDTDVPIYWVRTTTAGVRASDRVADDYTDFYDGTWDTQDARTESGAFLALGFNVAWTGTNTDGTTHTTNYMGKTGTGEDAAAWSFSGNSITVRNLHASSMQRILALSPVFEVGAFTTDPRVTSIEHHDPPHSPTNANSLIWRVTFDEVVSNVDAADFSVTGTTATVTTVTGSGATYDVTASGGDLADLDTTVTLAFASGQDIEDAAGNALSNTTPRGTSENSYRVDNTAPTVTITVPATSSAPFTATFTFSEPVLEFVVGDIGLGNATASNFKNITAKVYTARIAPAAPGTVTVDVAADVAEDLAGNGNTAALQARSTYTTPVVTCNAPNLDGRHQIWSALVTVGELTDGRNVVRHGFTQTVGDLSERNFRIGPKSYNVREITQWVISNRILSLTLNRDLNEYELNHLTLHVCAQAFPLNEATGGDHDYYWRNSGLDWSATPTRQVVLSALGEPTVEDRLSAGDCQDLDEYPNCGIGLSIDQRAGGYSDRGAIQSAGDRDLWTVVLYRAQSYLIEVKGAGDPGGVDGGTLPDPWVEIYELTYEHEERRMVRDPTLRASNDNVNSDEQERGCGVHLPAPGPRPRPPSGSG